MIGGRALLANPGGIPELPQMASGLARAGLLDRYVTPVTASVGGGLGLLAGLPGTIGARTRGVLERRPDPTGVPAERVAHRATGFEIASALAHRLPPPRIARALSNPALALASTRFDAATARLVEAGHGAVIGAHLSSLSTFRRASELGVPSFLQYPLAHHRYAERLLREEAGLEPEFAQTLQFHSVPPRLDRRLQEEIARADRIFTVSSFHRRTFVEEGVDEERFIDTPLGVDLDLFRPTPRGEDSTFRVVFVGQIGQRKGLSYLLDGFAQAGLADAELALVGAAIGTTAPWRDRPGVRHYPPRPRATLPELYASADVYVLPSLIEGFPLTALEAMASGKPVIVSDHTFADDVVSEGEDGYVIPIRDAGAIAERLRELHSNPGERSRMGAAARRTAERFSWESYGDRVAAALSEYEG